MVQSQCMSSAVVQQSVVMRCAAERIFISHSILIIDLRVSVGAGAVQTVAIQFVAAVCQQAAREHKLNAVLHRGCSAECRLRTGTGGSSY